MREIIFRAWDENNNCFRDKDMALSILQDATVTGMEGYMVEQFTGLRDSKRTSEFPEGQMIFEGDLISDGHNNIGIVEWLSGDNPGFYLHWPNVETGGFDGIDKWGIVVGNIHEHKNLLDGGEK